MCTVFRTNNFVDQIGFNLYLNEGKTLILNNFYFSFEAKNSCLKYPYRLNTLARMSRLSWNSNLNRRDGVQEVIGHNVSSLILCVICSTFRWM